MIKEEDIKLGLKFGIYEEVEERDGVLIHKSSHPNFNYELENKDWCPIKFIVFAETDDGSVGCISYGQTFDIKTAVATEKYQPALFLISKKDLSPISYEWFEAEKEGYSMSRHESIAAGIERDLKEKALLHADIVKSLKKEDYVSHPSHYAWLKELCGVEPIDICRHFGFSVGNALKYLMRKGKVDGDKTETEKRVEDLKKAVFYLQDEIMRLENEEAKD